MISKILNIPILLGVSKKEKELSLRFFKREDGRWEASISDDLFNQLQMFISDQTYILDSKRGMEITYEDLDDEEEIVQYDDIKNENNLKENK